MTAMDVLTTLHPFWQSGAHQSASSPRTDDGGLTFDGTHIVCSAQLEVAIRSMIKAVLRYACQESMWKTPKCNIMLAAVCALESEEESVSSRICNPDSALWSQQEDWNRRVLCPLRPHVLFETCRTVRVDLWLLLPLSTLLAVGSIA